MFGKEKHIRLLLTGGGTGGHLFPALATAEEICSRYPETKIMFIGTRRKMDTVSLEESGYEVSSIFCYGLKGKNLPDLLKALAILPISLLQAMARIFKFKPDIVLGVGGYVTGPVIAAAKLMGKKTVIHEQNSIPGLANRKLGGVVDKICLSLPQSSKYFAREKTVLTGNPVRKPILEVASQQSRLPKNGEVTILVLGGSQGAHRVNELVIDALCKHGESFSGRVIHQTGAADSEMVRKAYDAQGIRSTVQPFFRDMAAIYKEADLLISRAGATTLAEIAVLGKPAILIPYPYAADDHQAKNAEYYIEGGGCLGFTEAELTGEILAAQIKALLRDQTKLLTMAEQMNKLAMPQAASTIVDVCIESLSGNS